MTDRVAIQSIYERSDKEIQQREAIIDSLRKELSSFKVRELPNGQVTNELIAQYPALKGVTMTRGYRMSTDSMTRTEEIIIILNADKKIPEDNMEKLRKWLTVRLDFDDIILFQE